MCATASCLLILRPCLFSPLLRNKEIAEWHLPPRSRPRLSISKKLLPQSKHTPRERFQQYLDRIAEKRHLDPCKPSSKRAKIKKKYKKMKKE
jgi:hypothetical protein